MMVGKDENRPTYFLGSVVYYKPSVQTRRSVESLLVIDGQQRLTTSILLLTALARYLEANQEPLADTTSSRKIRAYYLTNDLEAGDLSQRLLLTKRDKPTLTAVVNNNPLPEFAAERVCNNFAFFTERINATNVAALWAGISKLMVVEVVLEPGVDNPQLIFESLNSTGKRLDDADLIRNYVLMGQAPEIQNALYERYWNPMEEAFGAAYSTMFNEFMRDFLAMKLGRLVNIYTVYDTFKKDYAVGKTTPNQVDTLAAELYEHAKYYVRLRQLSPEDHPALRQALKQLSSFGVTVAYPYLLSAYAASSAGQLSKDELAEVVRMIERYVVRRAVCGVPTNTLNNTFVGFRRQLAAENYLDSVKRHFLELGSSRRFPRDEEFRQNLVMRDTYHASRTRSYLLRHLENYQRREKVNIGEYTVEHIMPQNENVSAEWQQELGENWQEVHRRYLHTLGNLTLTGYNSELSDRPFEVKKQMPGGFVSSPIKLNQSVAVEPVWNEAAILKRANMLADWAIAIWPAPQVAESIMMEEEEVDEEAEEAALAEAGLLEADPTDEQE